MTRVCRQRGLPAFIAVEIDEADRLVRPVGVGDAGAEAGGDERQVRIGVLRLDDALLGGELHPAIEPVVLVVGALRERWPGTRRCRPPPRASASSRDATLRSRKPAVVCDDQYRQCG